MTESKASPQLWAMVMIAVAIIACLGTVISAIIAKVPVPTSSVYTPAPILVIVTETPSILKSPAPENIDVEITSTTGWQSTGSYINSGDKLIITVVDGSWTSQKATTLFNSGEGDTSYICGNLIDSYKCVEPMPDFPTGGLIGQIGSQKFWVGNGTTITVQQSGVLQLRINDGDDGLYDNDGTLQVNITVK